MRDRYPPLPFSDEGRRRHKARSDPLELPPPRIESGGGPQGEPPQPLEGSPGEQVLARLWNSLELDPPEQLGIGDARQRFPQLVSSAQDGLTYVVRNMNRPADEAVVLVSLAHLHRIAASMGEPISGSDILARLPFGDTAYLEELRPAELPNPGLPRNLVSLLRSEANGDTAAAQR